MTSLPAPPEPLIVGKCCTPVVVYIYYIASVEQIPRTRGGASHRGVRGEGFVADSVTSHRFVVCHFVQWSKVYDSTKRCLVAVVLSAVSSPRARNSIVSCVYEFIRASVSSLVSSSSRCANRLQVQFFVSRSGQLPFRFLILSFTSSFVQSKNIANEWLVIRSLFL